MTDKITFARSQRRNPTAAEQAFWAVLYPWREAGMHWRRQTPVGPYVVDFVCKKRKLIVEIDGDSHYFDEGIRRDTVRTVFLERWGFRVVRFSNADVLGNPEGVFEVLCGILGDVT
ncbi:endonuclease domain-containing protein [Devosia rhizoryzae]|uniref:Endonuclease domain-containing protein n=1 Tax=Devosia rhizoryzae TaxID=2774137 RepID=A0ABX7CBD2_9HYPH|nr:endonuclease domain-containing protein [Devosia rhizoryzae]QQR39910.1 endonuclease domain-containing protein [Devosia rhizoryzae]